jgi:hypothetical protein
MPKRTLLTFIMIVTCAAATVAPAAADISAGVGGFTQSGNGSSSTGAAAFLSSGKAVPILPAEIDLTGFVPLANKGGYAVTLEGRAGILGTYVGAGYGLGQFGAASTSGMFTAFVGTKVLPFTSLELRGYKGTASNGSAAFLGLRLSL